MQKAIEAVLSAIPHDRFLEDWTARMTILGAPGVIPPFAG